MANVPAFQANRSAALSSTSGATGVYSRKLVNRHLRVGLLAYLALSVVSVALGVLYVVLFGPLGIISSVLMTFTAEVATIVLALAYTRHLGNWKHFLRLDGFTWRKFLSGMGIGALVWVLLQVTTWSLTHVAGVHLESSDTSTSLASIKGFWFYAVYLFLVPFIIPFIEETFYRALTIRCIQVGFRGRRKGNIVAVVFASVIFGLAHFQGVGTASDAFVVLWTMLIGLVNALLFLKQDTVWGGYGVHLTYNGITVLLTVLAMSL